MYKKLICLISFVLVLGLAGSTLAELVAYWPLDEGSGTTAVDVIGGYDGTIGGTANWVPGMNGLALDFDGSSTYIDVDGEIVRGTFTYASWIRPRDIPYTSADQDYYAVMHTDAWSAGAVHAHLRQGTSLLNMDINSGPGVTSTTVLQEDEWYHFALTVDGGASQLYINGMFEAEGSGGGNAFLGPLNFGSWNNSGRNYHGLMDDIRIYDHVLSEVEVLGAMAGQVWPYASSPTPEDGALHPDTWVSLSWKPGGLAASHDVYFGENFDDVNNATPDSDVFRVNQSLGIEFFIAGFFGYPYPDGLVNGTTYYWRIDEVNEADPNSPWKGAVWSFMVPPKTAYDPAPADNAKFIDSEGTTLSWTAGFGSKLHHVYFGDDYDTVANAAGAPPLASTTYSPGPLEIEKTYYWRVDESDGANTFPGDVWSFTTAKEGGGIRADYYNGMNFENHVLTRIDPEVDFNWGNPGSPDPAVGVDQFSCRWTGEVEAAFTETYTFYGAADDGVRLWVDGVQLVDAWIDQGTTEYSGTIDLEAGNSYSVVMEQYENGGGATAYLRWSSPSTPKQIIPQAALSPPIKASSPSPNNGATGTKMTPILRWGAGDYAASHEVYFGTDAEAVANADKSSPEYKGTKALGDESFDPGKLAWFTQYFWRIDEVNAVNPDSPWAGNLWNFTTGDFIVIDDFEDYDSSENQIWYSWHDGLGYGAPGVGPYFAGNGTGAA
ncbi:MAG: PA14 domain-containing protein, partial [Planctomycetota bacterium]